MLKNIGANWALALLKMATAFVLMPYTIRMLGTEQYSVWILIGSITGYMALMILGVPAASARFMAKAAAEKDHAKLNDYIASFASLYLLLGAICVAVGVGLYFALTRLFEIPAEFQSHAQAAFAIVIGTTAAGFVLQLPYAIFSAHHEFVGSNTVLATTTLFRFVATFALLRWWPSVIVVAAIQGVALVLEFALAWAMIGRKYPHIRLRFGALRWTTLREILGFSLFVMVLSVGAQLSYQTDALVIGRFLHVGQIAFFAVANNLALYYIEFLVGIASVVMPMTTRLQTEGNHDGLRELFLKWSKIALGLSMIGGLFLIVLGPRFLAWWVGPTFEEPAGRVLQILMTSYLVYLPVRAVSQPMLIGLGMPNKPAMGFLVAGVSNLILSITLAQKYGIAGVALGTAIPNAAYAIYLASVTCRAIQLPFATYFRYVYGRAGIAAVPVMAVLYAFRVGLDARTFVELAVAGTTSAVLCVALWFGVIVRGDKYLGNSFAQVRARFAK
ncbi:MAG: polysaccharide biosynthesis protein [Gemmatimonadaceae bacterium]|nr:polysaccharide biosynthesis protein [Gemmatimonadaceae bacterium]